MEPNVTTLTQGGLDMTRDDWERFSMNHSNCDEEKLTAAIDRIATLEGDKRCLLKDVMRLEAELRTLRWETKLEAEKRERDLKRQQIRLDEIKWSPGREITV
jgi:hypothetical protein